MSGEGAAVVDVAAIGRLVLGVFKSEGRCRSCWRGQPSDQEWETVPEGGRPDLCWDGPYCVGADGQYDQRLATHVAEALAAALAPVMEGAVRKRVKGHRWLGGYFCECGHELNSAAGHLEHVMAAAFGRSAHE